MQLETDTSDYNSEAKIDSIAAAYAALRGRGRIFMAKLPMWCVKLSCVE